MLWNNLQFSDCVYSVVRSMRFVDSATCGRGLLEFFAKIVFKNFLVFWISGSFCFLFVDPVCEIRVPAGQLILEEREDGDFFPRDWKTRGQAACFSEFLAVLRSTPGRSRAGDSGTLGV